MSSDPCGYQTNPGSWLRFGFVFSRSRPLLLEIISKPVEQAGNVFIADSNNNRIRAVTSTGVISTIAGTGASGRGGNGGAELSATLDHPTGLSRGPNGSLLFADLYSNWFRKLTPVP